MGGAGDQILAGVQCRFGGAGAGQVEAGRARGHAAAHRRAALAAPPAAARTRTCYRSLCMCIASGCGVQNTGALQAIRRLPQGPACGHHERHLIDRPLRIAAGTARSSSSSPRYTCTLRQTSSNICTSHLGMHSSGGLMRCAWHDCSDMTEVFPRPASLTANQGVELGRCWRAPQGSTARTGGGRGRISPTTRSPHGPVSGPSQPSSKAPSRPHRAHASRWSQATAAASLKLIVAARLAAGDNSTSC